MIRIHSSALDSLHSLEFRKWIEAEWGAVDPFDSKYGKRLPAPVLALDNEILIGGLSFTYAPVPGNEDDALWINTVFVAPEFRRKGVASKLVHAAEGIIAGSGEQQLFVYTPIAGLYLNLGWRIYSGIDGEDMVLTKEWGSGASREWQ